MFDTANGLKVIALLEATKGVLSLLVGFGIHALAGDNIQQMLESLLSHLHLNPASHLPAILLHETTLLTPSNLTLIALGALIYAVVRLIEAYGLWHGLVWTEWFALLSGGIYLPFEIYELVVSRNLLSIAVLAVNLAIVWYMYSLLMRKKHV
ncbi:DUF2127 domain-containing protein [Amphritea sp.]|uniref:DUF2127 domain-containing protein n=1 Tax=Amphritea sp. TaxID=1872502 RepID=UPI003D096C31